MTAVRRAQRMRVARGQREVRKLLPGVMRAWEKRAPSLVLREQAAVLRLLRKYGGR